MSINENQFSLGYVFSRLRTSEHRFFYRAFIVFFILILPVFWFFYRTLSQEPSIPSSYQMETSVYVVDPMTTLSFPAYPRILMTQADIPQIKQKITSYDWARNNFSNIESQATQILTDPDFSNPITIPTNISDTAGQTKNNKLAEALINLGMAFYFSEKPDTERLKYAQKANDIILAYLAYFKKKSVIGCGSGDTAGYLYDDSFAESGWTRGFVPGYDLALGIKTNSINPLITARVQSDVQTYILDRLLNKFRCHNKGNTSAQNKKTSIITAKGLIGIVNSNPNTAKSIIREAFNTSTTYDNYLGQLTEGFTNAGYWTEGPSYQYGVVLNSYLRFIEAIYHCGGKTVYQYPGTGNNFTKALNAIPLYLMTPDGSFPAFEDSPMYQTVYNYYEQIYSHLVSDGRAVAYDHQFYPWLIRKIDPTRIGFYSLTDGVGVLPDNGPYIQNSVASGLSGFAALRNGPVNNQSLATLEFHSGWLSTHLHAHDTFSLSYFANGKYLVPELGKGNYDSPYSKGYFREGIGHNNFTVDKKSIGFETTLNTTELGHHDKVCTTDWKKKSNIKILGSNLSGNFQFVTVSGTCIGDRYPNSNWFVANVKRSILLTPDYLLDILALTPTDKGHTFDVPLHVNLTNANLNLPNAAPVSPLGTANGYQYLLNTRGGLATGNYDATWDDGETFLRINDLSNINGRSVYLADAPMPIDINGNWINKPMLIRRALIPKNTTRQFVSVLESYKNNNRILSNVSLSGNILTVLYQDGRKHTINMQTLIGTIENIGAPAPMSPSPVASPNPSPSATTPVQTLISNLVTNQAKWSIRHNLQQGNTQYSDRTYILTSIPEAYRGADWIQTANTSKSYTGNPIATFTVTKNSDVYIALDDRVSKPSWINDWQDTGDNIRNNESSPVTFSLYRYKNTLPANSIVSLKSQAYSKASMYFVIIRPPVPQSSTVIPSPMPSATARPLAIPTNLVTGQSNWSIQSNLHSGDKQYGDRDYKIDIIPNELVGVWWIRTANASKSSTTNPLATFTVTQNSDVYIALDDRVSKPSWMGDFTDTGSDLQNSEPLTFSLYKKTYSANSQVSLGPLATNRAMYTVFIKSLP